MGNPSSPLDNLSYDDCLEGRLSELFCAVLCHMTVHNNVHTDMSSSYIWAVLGVGFLHFYQGQFICVRLSYSVFCVFPLLLFGCQYQCNRLPWKIRVRNDLLCVKWDVKTTHSVNSSDSQIQIMILTRTLRNQLGFYWKFMQFDCKMWQILKQAYNVWQ